MTVFTVRDLELLFLGGKQEHDKGKQEHDLRKQFQGTLLKLIGERLESFNNEIDECKEEIDELLDKQLDLTSKPFTKTTEAKYEAISDDIAEVYKRKDILLADVHDLMAILWKLASVARPYSGWRPDSIESVLAERKVRLSKVGMAERKETRKAGRPAIKLQALAARMRADIEVGKLTRETLQNIPIKQLSHRFGAHRDTAIRARQIVLGDQDGHVGVIEQALEAEMVENSVIEFPTQKTFISE
jgi:hypothetical protein